MKKGLLTFLIMNVIKKKKNCYGYEIIQEIKEKSGITIAEGTLYPLLKKLNDNKITLCKWSVNDDHAPRKYYYLTGTGNNMLEEMRSYWTNLNKSVISSIEE